MFDWIFGEDMDIEDIGEALATGVLDNDENEPAETRFIFDGKGYYGEEGIRHDSDVKGD